MFKVEIECDVTATIFKQFYPCAPLHWKVLSEHFTLNTYHNLQNVYPMLKLMDNPFILQRNADQPFVIGELQHRLQDRWIYDSFILLRAMESSCGAAAWFHLDPLRFYQPSPQTPN